MYFPRLGPMEFHWPRRRRTGDINITGKHRKANRVSTGLWRCTRRGPGPDAADGFFRTRRGIVRRQQHCQEVYRWADGDFRATERRTPGGLNLVE